MVDSRFRWSVGIATLTKLQLHGTRRRIQNTFNEAGSHKRQYQERSNHVFLILARLARERIPFFIPFQGSSDTCVSYEIRKRSMRRRQFHIKVQDKLVSKIEVTLKYMVMLQFFLLYQQLYGQGGRSPPQNYTSDFPLCKIWVGSIRKGVERDSLLTSVIEKVFDTWKLKTRNLAVWFVFSVHFFKLWLGSPLLLSITWRLDLSAYD